MKNSFGQIKSLTAHHILNSYRNVWKKEETNEKEEEAFWSQFRQSKPN
jgi:hypothetical protein